MTIPLISVIITTKNEEDNIRYCLKSIKQQTYPKEFIEMIVIDNNSTDKTKEIAKQYTKLVFNFGPERSAQRNYGINKCHGEYFLQLDADQSLDKNVIEECVKKIVNFKDNDKSNNYFADIALQVPENIVGSKNYFNRIRNYEKVFYTNSVIDCVRFIPTKIIKDIGGYDCSLNGPEDWDLDQRIREKCYIDIIDSHMDHNEGNVTFLKFLEKKWYYSKSFGKYISKWGKNNRYVKLRLGFFYRYIGVFVENKKYKNVLIHPMLFASLIGTKLILGGVFLGRTFADKFKTR
ncbi:MAG: glycosyltransferase [Patescibacteria group bacterium]|jgi:glycosyltransferase involved in cell wall biosynthesis